VSNQIESSKGTGPGEWLTPGRFARLLLLLVCVSYPDVMTLQRTFFHRDFGAFGYPLAAWHRECFWRGEVPLWNPLSYCGLPFLAEWNTLTLYPGSLIYLVLPVAWGLGIFCVAHFFLAGMGAYYLARRWTGHNLGAAIAGIGFTFNALLLNSLMWPNNMAAFAWMPWVVLLVEAAWREGGRRIVPAALAGGMQMLAGAPEVIILTWLTLLALWLGQFWMQATQRRAMIVRCVAVVGLVSALAAAQLLPFLDLLKYSQRHTDFGDSAWAMPWWGWAHLVVPQFRTLASPLGPRFQPEQGWVDTYYLGIGTLLLGLLAAWRVPGRRVRLLALLAGGSLLLALGEKAGVYLVAKKVVPVFGFMRYPVKFVIWLTFISPLLAAFAVRHLLETPREQWLALRQRLFSVGAALLGVMAGIVVLDRVQPYKNVEWSTTIASAATRALLLVLVIGLVIYLRRVTDSVARRWLQVALPVLLWVDVMTFGPRPNPTIPASEYQPGLMAGELKPAPRIGDGRAMVSLTAEVALNANPLPDAIDHFNYGRLGLMANFNLLEEVPKITGAYSLYFRELEQLLYQVYFSATNVPPGLADFMSISQITAPGRNIAWQARPTAMPWITGGQRPVFADAAATLAGLNAPDFNPRNEVFLPAEARALVANTNRAEVRLSAVQVNNQQITLEADAAAPALVLISQNYYHRWRPRVNQQPVPLLRANHAFQAVPIPAGHSRVELVYEDPAFKLGVALSGLGLLLCGLLWWRPPRFLKG
jgi:hypothetical protein